MVSQKKTNDPIRLARLLWPDDKFYRQQREIVYSVFNNRETIVPAGNELGKDWVAARIAILFFLTRYPCRIVTTSAKDDHLRVLWGEIGDAIRTSAVPLKSDEGGPLVVTHREIKTTYNGSLCPISYIRGMVAGQDSIAAMQGHHVKQTGDGIPRTLFMSDESSSVPDEYFKMVRTWAKSMFIFGNPWDCSNYFYRAVEGDIATNDKGGDIVHPDDPTKYIRKVIRIRAEDSPNVRYGLWEKEQGRKPSNRMIIPGVKSYGDYILNRIQWDPIQQTVSLDAEFYKGKEVRLFPKQLLDRCQQLAKSQNGAKKLAKAMGVDAAEGGDDTVWTVVNNDGVIHQLTLKTSDTQDIPGQTIALIRQFSLNAADVFFDRGGGGKQIADQLRRAGYDVRTIGFGESATDPWKDRKTSTIKHPVPYRVNQTESRYSFKNRRAEMYGVLSDYMAGENGFAIASEYSETIRQLSAIPKKYDGEGRLYLPPKDQPNDNYTGQTLRQMLGRSPDQADSLVLAVFGMLRRPSKVVVGAAL